MALAEPVSTSGEYPAGQRLPKLRSPEIAKYRKKLFSDA
jgi:hypothetical protein